MRRIAWAVAGGVVLSGIAWWSMSATPHVSTARALATPEELAAHCRDAIGDPRVEDLGQGIHVAIGFDLSNTILLEVDGGIVVVDVGSNPERAAVVREAFGPLAARPVLAVLFTHSHIDHVNGATVWVEEGTEVWATEALEPHFFKQYGLFREAEQRRGARQFAHGIAHADVPCSALGRQVDINASGRTGVILPTHTFSGMEVLEIGGRRLELHEAHGETDDQLFVWVPDAGALLPGDNYYRTFPNLYTIRGTRPRPVTTWIESLDRMRALSPSLLVPSHTVPVRGATSVAHELQVYRDGIQWVRDAAIRGANADRPVDVLAAEIGLPEHLRGEPALRELYGQVDWSVRAIYGNQLGWFDGQARNLYPQGPEVRRARWLALAGGPQAVEAAVRRAQDEGDHAWALELVDLLPEEASTSSELEVRSLRALAAETTNTNGRGYLLRVAEEREGGGAEIDRPQLNEGMIDGVPLDLMFRQMTVRLRPESAIDVHEAVRFVFPDEGREFLVVVRRGVAEVRVGRPLPGSPEPLATVTVDGSVWRRVGMGQRTAAGAVASGELAVEGDAVGFLGFMARFDRGL